MRASLMSTDTSALTKLEKGALGETRAALVYRRAGYTELPARLSSNNGFDGVFVKYDARGQPIDIIINESKFASNGRARFGETNMGTQMGTRWIDGNINNMLRAADLDVQRTGRLLRENPELIRRKVNVTDANGVNRWNSLELPR
jgi:hypothetical protein